MKKIFITLMLVAICPQIQPSQTFAQSATQNALPRYEYGVDFTTLTINQSQTHLGTGHRFTINLNRQLALESAAIFFSACDICGGEVTGTITEGLFGVKAGQRFKKFGIFGKARPGFINYSKGYFELSPTGGTGLFPFSVVAHHQTNFAADLGGVVEIYPSKRMLVRFDGSMLVDHFGSRNVRTFTLDPTTGAIIPFTYRSQPYTRGLFQFSAGVGFRF